MSRFAKFSSNKLHYFPAVCMCSFDFPSGRHFMFTAKKHTAKNTQCCVSFVLWTFYTWFLWKNYLKLFSPMQNAATFLNKRSLFLQESQTNKLYVPLVNISLPGQEILQQVTSLYLTGSQTSSTIRVRHCIIRNLLQNIDTGLNF